MIVRVTVPGVALLDAASVSVLVSIVLVGLNDAVTPAGNDDVDKLTVPAKPFSGATLIVLVPLLPCETVKLLGFAESAKLGAGVTINVIDVPLLRPFAVPVIPIVNVPVAATLLALTVSVLLPVDVLAGLKLAVTPEGNVPDVDRLTASLKPF